MPCSLECSRTYRVSLARASHAALAFSAALRASRIFMDSCTAVTWSCPASGSWAASSRATAISRMEPSSARASASTGPRESHRYRAAASVASARALHAARASRSAREAQGSRGTESASQKRATSLPLFGSITTHPPLEAREPSRRGRSSAVPSLQGRRGSTRHAARGRGPAS